MLGPVNGATIEAYRMHDTGAFEPFSPPRTTTSAADGTYSLDVGGYTGPLVLAATGGTYTDEATGTTKTIPPATPLYSCIVLAPGTTMLQINPVTHLATAVANSLARHAEEDAGDAITNAYRVVEDFFGLQNAATVDPADLTAGAVSPGNPADYGAVIAGISQEASGLGTSGLDPMELVDQLAGDVADGRFDDRTFGDPLSAGTELGSNRLYTRIQTFLTSNPNNASGLTIADVGSDDAVFNHIDPTGPSPHPAYPAWPARVYTANVTSGPTGGGTTILITGDGIDSGNGVEVLFGGVPGVLGTSANDSVSVTSPAAANAGKVEVVVRDPTTGVTAPLQQGFTYYDTAPPAIAGLCPEWGPVMGGALLEIRGSGFDPTSEVLLDGTPVTIEQLEPPGRIVARMPAHAAGTVNVQVRNGTVLSGNLPFSYRDRDVDIGLDDADLAGSWHIYCLEHDHSAGGGAGAFSAVRHDLSFDGTGGATGTRTQRTASPTDPTGTTATAPETAGYGVLPDGAFWLDLTPAEPIPENHELRRGWIQEQGDIFALHAVQTPARTALCVGMRAVNGMNNASVAGTYWLAGLTHMYAGGGPGRDVITLFGSVQLDGTGQASANMLASDRETGSGSFGRLLAPATFTYNMSSDGRITVTDSEGTVFQGSFTGSSDFAVLLEQGSDGELAMFFLVRRGFGMRRSSLRGSWYGASYGYDLTGTLLDSHTYEDAGTSALGDLTGVTLIEELRRSSSDTALVCVPDERLEAGFLTAGPAGLLFDEAAPSSFVVGAVSGSDRVMIVQDHALLDNDATENNQDLGILFRNCSRFTQASIAPQYNSVTMTHDYFDTNFPPSNEVMTNTRGTFIFDPPTPVFFGARPFLASGTVLIPGGPTKIAAWDSGQITTADFQGGYAVLGNGRLYILGDVAVLDQRRLSQNFTVQFPALGQLAPHGDAAFLRTYGRQGVLAGWTILARAAINATLPSGDYTYTDFCLGWDFTCTRVASAQRGMISVDDPTPGSFSGTLDKFERLEDGTETTTTGNPAPGTYVATADGKVTITPAGSTPFEGVFTPDGSLIVFADTSVNSVRVCLGVMTRRNTTPTPPPLAGFTGLLGAAHWVPNGLTVPPVAATDVSEGVQTLTPTTGLLGGLTFERQNIIDPAVLLIAGLDPGIAVTVSPDGTLAATALGDSLRGGVSDNRRYASLVPGDPTPNDTAIFFLLGR